MAQTLVPTAVGLCCELAALPASYLLNGSLGKKVVLPNSLGSAAGKPRSEAGWRGYNSGPLISLSMYSREWKWSSFHPLILLNQQ